jgi:autotransporter adhesin
LQYELNDTNLRIDNLAHDIDHLRDETYSGLAGIAAMGAIPDATIGKTAIGIGYGNYGGKDAAALGLSSRSENGKHAVTFSTTITTKETGVAAGYSFSF